MFKKLTSVSLVSAIFLQSFSGCGRSVVNSAVKDNQNDANDINEPLIKVDENNNPIVPPLSGARNDAFESYSNTKAETQAPEPPTTAVVEGFSASSFDPEKNELHLIKTASFGKPGDLVHLAYGDNLISGRAQWSASVGKVGENQFGFQISITESQKSTRPQSSTPGYKESAVPTDTATAQNKPMASSSTARSTPTGRILAPDTKSEAVTIVTQRVLTEEQFLAQVETEIANAKTFTKQTIKSGAGARGSILAQMKNSAVVHNQYVKATLGQIGLVGRINANISAASATETSLSNSFNESRNYLEYALAGAATAPTVLKEMGYKLIEAAQKRLQFGDVAGAQKRLGVANRVSNALVHSNMLPPREIPANADSILIQRVNALNSGLILLDVGHQIDEAGFARLAENTLESAAIHFEVAMTVASYFDLVGVPMNMMEVFVGKTLKIDPHTAAPIWEPVTNVERATALASIALSVSVAVASGGVGSVALGVVKKTASEFTELAKAAISKNNPHEVAETIKKLAMEIIAKTDN